MNYSFYLLWITFKQPHVVGSYLLHSIVLECFMINRLLKGQFLDQYLSQVGVKNMPLPTTILHHHHSVPALQKGKNLTGPAHPPFQILLPSLPFPIIIFPYIPRFLGMSLESSLQGTQLNRFGTYCQDAASKHGPGTRIKGRAEHEKQHFLSATGQEIHVQLRN